MNVIIAGSRHINDYAVVIECMCEAQIQHGIVPTCVNWGGAPGVDALGKRWAEENKIAVRPFMAQWKTFGKAAGPMRNTAMARGSDALIAIWDERSPGTENMIGQAIKFKLNVVIFRYPWLARKR